MSLIKVRSGQPESSSSVHKHKRHLALWDTNAPAKAKIHMWRMIRNGLASGAELHRRWIKPGVFRVVCGRQETIVHRFLAYSNIHLSFGGSCVQRRRLATPPIPMNSQSELSPFQKLGTSTSIYNTFFLGARYSTPKHFIPLRNTFWEAQTAHW